MIKTIRDDAKVLAAFERADAGKGLAYVMDDHGIGWWRRGWQLSLWWDKSVGCYEAGFAGDPDDDGLRAIVAADIDLDGILVSAIARVEAHTTVCLPGGGHRAKIAPTLRLLRRRAVLETNATGRVA